MKILIQLFIVCFWSVSFLGQTCSHHQSDIAPLSANTNVLFTEDGSVTLQGLTVEQVRSYPPYGNGISFVYPVGEDIDGFLYKVFADGEQITFRSLRPDERSTPFLSYKELNIVGVDVVRIEIWSFKGTNRSESLIVDIPQIRKPLRESNNKFSYYLNYEYGIDAVTGGFTEAWTKEEAALIIPRLEKMAEKSRQIFGPWGMQMPTKVTKLIRSNRASKQPEFREIQISVDVSDEVLAHEVGWHDMMCPLNLSIDSLYNFNYDNLVFEEGLAAAAEYFITGNNRFNSDVYEIENNEQLISKTFFPLSGVGEASSFYGAAGTCWLKIEQSNSGAIREFIELVFKRIDTEGAQFSRAFLEETLGMVVDRVEGKTLSEWLDEQYIFQSRVALGDKITVVITPQYYNTETIWFIRAFYHTTHPNGLSWYYNDPESGRIYHNKNGAKGSVSFSIRGVPFRTMEVTVNPTENPPDNNVFGSVSLVLTSKADNEPSFVDGLRSWQRVSIPLEQHVMDIDFQFGETKKNLKIPAGFFTGKEKILLLKKDGTVESRTAYKDKVIVSTTKPTIILEEDTTATLIPCESDIRIDLLKELESLIEKYK